MKKEVLATIIFGAVVALIIILSFLFTLTKSKKVLKSELDNGQKLVCMENGYCYGVMQGDELICPEGLISGPQYEFVLESYDNYKCECTMDCAIIILDDNNNVIQPED